MPTIGYIRVTSSKLLVPTHINAKTKNHIRTPLAYKHIVHPHRHMCRGRDTREIPLYIFNGGDRDSCYRTNDTTNQYERWWPVACVSPSPTLPSTALLHCQLAQSNQLWEKVLITKNSPLKLMKHLEIYSFGSTTLFY